MKIELRNIFGDYEGAGMVHSVAAGGPDAVRWVDRIFVRSGLRKFPANGGLDEARLVYVEASLCAVTEVNDDGFGRANDGSQPYRPTEKIMHLVDAE